MVDFLFITNELYLLSHMVEALQAGICRNWHFSNRGGHFQQIFQREGMGHCPPITVGVKISE